MRRMQDARVTPPIGAGSCDGCDCERPEYPIRMSTPTMRAELYVYRRGIQGLQDFSGDRVMNSRDYQVSFEGRAEILEVDKGGRAVKILLGPTVHESRGRRHRRFTGGRERHSCHGTRRSRLIERRHSRNEAPAFGAV